MTAADDQFDAEADATIIACLDLCKPRSFFLYRAHPRRSRYLDQVPLRAAQE